MNVKNHYMFENCVAKIFSEAGYSVVQNVRVGSAECDIIVVKDAKKYCVEVKCSQIIEKAIARICDTSKRNNMVPIIVTACYVEDRKRELFKQIYSDLILIDIANLLFAVQQNAELHNELVAGLSYAVDNIEAKEGFLTVDSLQHDDYTQSLIKEMELCEAGKLMAKSYEEICCKLLENIFSDELALWKEQQKSNKNLYKFDLLCRIKDGNQKTFWSILEKYFNSKYVIFEFKNYQEQVTQKEIYTTEKYLYVKALRSVGIMISQNGYDENAQWAAKGCLRENGKLIMLLETEDLIAMNRMKSEHEDPSDYLLEKLDELLWNLEK